MTAGAIGAVLLVLTGVVILGNLWYQLVEWVLEKFRRLLGRKAPGRWHTLPREERSEEESDGL